MIDRQFSALVVDDEPALRRLVAGTLARFNFSCDQAADGAEASSLVCRRKYDLVVTDLRMPIQNGHALAVELLTMRSDCPVIVVLTGVLEPRLAQDLITRGVDAVEFKPLNFPMFGAKVRALCDKRAKLQSNGKALPAAAESATTAPAGGEIERLTMSQLEEHLTALTRTLPVSPAAIDLVNLIDHEPPGAEVVAQRIARDPGLSVEVLKLANSSYYNPAGNKFDDLYTAILRIGHRKIGELALASTTLRILAKSTLPWVDADVIWRRCLATGQAIEHLQPAAALGGNQEGLFLSAMLLPMCRALLGLSCPGLYQQMIERCEQTGTCLGSLERKVLPLLPAAAVSRYFDRLGLSPQLCEPLKMSAIPPAKLAALAEPQRTRFEQLQLAASIGQLAVGRWARWEEVDFPSMDGLLRARVGDLVQLVDRVRGDLVRLTAGACSKPAGSALAATGDAPASQQRYFNMSVEACDPLALLLRTMNVRLVNVTGQEACQAAPVLVNCTGTTAEQLTRFIEECQPHAARVFVGSDERRPASSPRGSFLTLPVCFGRLADCLRAAAADAPPSDSPGP